MPTPRTTYGLGGFLPQAPNGNVVDSGMVPDDTSPTAVMRDRLAAQLTALRTVAAQADAASQQTAALTNAQITTQLRQTQAGLAAVTLATLRLARLVAGQLDDVD